MSKAYKTIVIPCRNKILTDLDALTEALCAIEAQPLNSKVPDITSIAMALPKDLVRVEVEHDSLGNTWFNFHPSKELLDFIETVKGYVT